MPWVKCFDIAYDIMSIGLLEYQRYSPNIQWILCSTLVSSSLMYPPFIFPTWQSLTKCISHLEITTIAHRGWEIQLNVSMNQSTYLSSSYCIPLMKSNCSLLEEYLDASGTLTLVPSWQLFTEINSSPKYQCLNHSWFIIQII